MGKIYTNRIFCIIIRIRYRLRKTEYGLAEDCGGKTMLKDTNKNRLETYELWGSGKIGECLGEGSFGQVFELNNVGEDGRAEAVKIVTIEYTEEAEREKLDKETFLLDGLRSTLDEIRQMMELKELKNLVSFYGYEDHPIRRNGKLEGYDVLIRMERLIPLEKHIKRRAETGEPFGERDCIQLGISVCTALIEATRLLQRKRRKPVEFIHRDIKPANIFISGDGVYKLGDLGTATANYDMQYTHIGTPAYMAPEMFGSAGYHSNVDLYALGKTLEKLTEAMTLTSGLQYVISTAERPDPDRRYQTAQEMKKALEECLYELEHCSESCVDEETDDERTVALWNQPTEKMTERLTRQLPEETRRVYAEPETVTAPEQPKARRGRKIPRRVRVLIPLAVVVAAAGIWALNRLPADAPAETVQPSELRAQVQEYTEQAEYGQALKILYDNSEAAESNNKLRELRTLCMEEYYYKVVNSADSAYRSGDARAAIDIIDENLKYFEGETFLSLEDIRQSYAGKDSLVLKDLPVSETNLNADKLYDYKTITDSQGNEYKGCYRLPSSGGLLGLTQGSGSISYDLNGSYSSLSLECFADPSMGADKTVRLSIFADGKLIYDSGNMKAAHRTKSAELSVDGADTLTIACGTADGSLLTRLVGRPKVCIVNARLKS